MRQPLIPDAVLYAHRVTPVPDDEAGVVFSAYFDLPHGTPATRTRFIQFRYAINPKVASAWSYRRGFARQPSRGQWKRLHDVEGIRAAEAFAKECIARRFADIAQDASRLALLSERAIPTVPHIAIQTALQALQTTTQTLSNLAESVE